MSAVSLLLISALVGAGDNPDAESKPPSTFAADLAKLIDAAKADAADPGDVEAFGRLVDRAGDWAELKTQDKSIPAADALRKIAVGDGPFAKRAAEALQKRRAAVLTDMARRGIDFGGFPADRPRNWYRFDIEDAAPPEAPHPLVRLRLLNFDAGPWVPADRPGLKDGSVDYVEIHLDKRKAKLTDAQFADLLSVPRLTRLYITTTDGLGPAWRDAIKEQPTLKILNLTRYNGRSGVTADDCAAIATIPNLTHVYVSRSPIGDDGLRALAKNPTIIWFDLEATGITDAGLRALAGRKEFEHIVLKNNPVTDAGFSVLPLKDVMFLDLSGTRCGDGALEHMIGRWLVPDPAWIKQMQEISDRNPSFSYSAGSYITLDGCPVTDAGLRFLAAAHVDTLSIQDTQIAGAGFDLWNAVGRTLPASLYVDRSAFNDAGCAELARGRVGQRLRLSLKDVPGVTLKGIALLRTLPRVKGLNVRGRPNRYDGSTRRRRSRRSGQERANTG